MNEGNGEGLEEQGRKLDRCHHDLTLSLTSSFRSTLPFVLFVVLFT